MFVKVQESTFASAINIRKFHIITVRRNGNGYVLSAYHVPLKDMESYQDIATFSNESQAQMAFNSLMNAIADGKNYWSLD